MPGVDWNIEGEEGELEEFDSFMASGYRQPAARTHFMTLDRADTQYVVNEMRRMAHPTSGHRRRLRRLER